MKNFSDYAKTHNQSGNNSNKKISENQGAFDLLKEISSKYEGASKDKMLAAIMDEAKKAKSEGRLNDVEIDNFVNTIYPMLNSSQQKQLLKVVKQIKENT